MKVLLLLIFILSGCSSGLSIRPGNCPGHVKLRSSRLTPDQKVEVKWREYGIGKQQANLSDILKDINAPECGSLDGLNITIQSTGLDQLVSAIPFVSQWTLILEWDKTRSK